MESELFCVFCRRCAIGDTQAVHSNLRKAVLEARGFKPSFLIKKVLSWQPKYDNLDAIISSALAWEKRKLK